MNDIRPQGFLGLPPVIKNIIIINVILFFAKIILGRSGIDLDHYLALYSLNGLDANNAHLFKPWQLITHFFMHGGSMVGPGADYEGGFMHIFGNMFGLWMFGTTLEQLWGSKKFFNFYMLCGIGAGLCQLIFDSSNGASVGASGAIFGILGAFAYLFPNNLLYLYFMFPVKVKYAIGFYALYELYAGVHHSTNDNIAHFAHLGGLVVGLIIVIIWNKTGKK